jgi:ferric-dicitrate binding protein FerR (iron transport regulator)
MAEMIYVTGDADQKKVTLGDGSVIHMNHQSQIQISSDLNLTNIEIQLQGEAYFQVTHNPDRIFRVVASSGVVEVLGTEFNVRSTAQGELHVAVTDGSVSFSNTSRSNEQEAVILGKGQNAAISGETGELVVENFGVENYLAWRTGRLAFDDLPLETICLQLNRLYAVICSFENQELKHLRLTANFSKESLENTLSVIAQSLRIGFESDGETVRWAVLAHHKRP